MLFWNLLCFVSGSQNFPPDHCQGQCKQKKAVWRVFKVSSSVRKHKCKFKFSNKKKLKSCKFLNHNVQEDERSKIADVMESQKFRCGDIIIKQVHLQWAFYILMRSQGDIIDSASFVYFLINGTCSISVNANVSTIKLLIFNLPIKLPTFSVTSLFVTNIIGDWKNCERNRFWCLFWRSRANHQRTSKRNRRGENRRHCWRYFFI